MRSSEPVDIRKKTGTFKSFDGTPIYYEVRGQGRPIFLCYGIACLINHWTHQIRYFSHEYQTIVFDYRGHHKTPIPKDLENLSLDAICKDMHGLMKHLGIERASFWGHSYGVMLLLKFFDLFPEAISNLVFINGFASNPLHGMLGGSAAPKLFHLFKEGFKAYPTALSTLWKTTVSNPLMIPLASLAGGFNMNLTSMKDMEVYARGVATMDLNAFITLFEQMMAYDASGVLEKIDVPTLVISGTKDGVTPLAHQERIHKAIKGSQFLRVPYGSHCTQLDHPDFVNLRIEKFLRASGYMPKPETEPPSDLHTAAGSLKRGRKRRAKPWD
jgi:pimeloyl-ACP methyl ester carboxylesterase